jgi:hypothetical protein
MSDSTQAPDYSKDNPAPLPSVNAPRRTLRDALDWVAAFVAAAGEVASAEVLLMGRAEGFDAGLIWEAKEELGLALRWSEKRGVWTWSLPTAAPDQAEVPERIPGPSKAGAPEAPTDARAWADQFRQRLEREKAERAERFANRDPREEVPRPLLRQTMTIVPPWDNGSDATLEVIVLADGTHLDDVTAGRFDVAELDQAGWIMNSMKGLVCYMRVVG